MSDPLKYKRYCDNCGKVANIIFYNQGLHITVNYCWDCYESAKYSKSIGRQE